MPLRYSLLFLPILLLLSACGPSLLLEEESVRRLPAGPTTEHQVLFTSAEFRVEGKSVTTLTRRVLRVGNDLASVPDLLTVPDYPSSPLQAYQARVHYANGKTRSYGRSDLIWTSLSRSSSITAGAVHLLPLAGDLHTGDLIETVEKHGEPFPEFGAAFVPTAAGAIVADARCIFDLPAGTELQFRVMNDSVVPFVTEAEGRRRIEFCWKDLRRGPAANVFSHGNSAPKVLATIPGAGIAGWREFGDWYLRLIADRLVITPEIRAKAEALVRNCATPREKMDAIARYCQSSVRYEQVYVENGEFIPNPIGTVLSRGYGDCKDYASLIWGLGRAAGLRPLLALCHRGRGYRVDTAIPVDQFNHMIACFRDGTEMVWYDGTNQLPVAGVTSFDVVNAPALVLDEGSSAIEIIREDPGNLMEITGELSPQGSMLRGEVVIGLFRQYAIETLFAERYLNKAAFAEVGERWFRANVSQQARILSTRWSKSETGFALIAKVEIPNALLDIPPETYVSLSRVFDRLLPAAP